jgi:hypothetical protein
MATEAPHGVGVEPGRMHVRAEHYRSACSTCDIIAGLSANLTDLMPQAEAMYIEHLIREHDISP